jgi:TPR repeat protein
MESSMARGIGVYSNRDITYTQRWGFSLHYGLASFNYSLLETHPMDSLRTHSTFSTQHLQDMPAKSHSLSEDQIRQLSEVKNNVPFITMMRALFQNCPDMNVFYLLKHSELLASSYISLEACCKNEPGLALGIKRIAGDFFENAFLSDHSYLKGKEAKFLLDIGNFSIWDSPNDTAAKVQELKLLLAGSDEVDIVFREQVLVQREQKNDPEAIRLLLILVANDPCTEENFQVICRVMGAAKLFDQLKPCLQVPTMDAKSKASVLFLQGRLSHNLDGFEGVTQDFKEAGTCYKAAEQLGSHCASNNLGYMYANGHGVPQDYTIAKAYYEKAATAGSADALNNLGTMYEHGHGVPQDHAKAKAYFDKAATAGSADTLYNLGTMYHDGHGVPQDHAKAKAYYEKAATAGNAGALNNLGYMYEHGQGVPQDHAIAKAYFVKAATAGSASALNNLDKLKTR